MSLCPDEVGACERVVLYMSDSDVCVYHDGAYVEGPLYKLYFSIYTTASLYYISSYI